MGKIDHTIRPMSVQDLAVIISRFSFPWSTPEKTKKIWQTYFDEQQNGVRTVAVIEKNGKIVGYGSLLRKSEYLNFVTANFPEINAIWIDENHQNQGLATALIKWIEKRAIQEGYKKIGIGVGLYHDYGLAQRLYFKLGYAPDGNGITYKCKTAVAGEAYPLDDDLILWLTKEI